MPCSHWSIPSTCHRLSLPSIRFWNPTCASLGRMKSQADRRVWSVCRQKLKSTSSTVKEKYEACKWQQLKPSATLNTRNRIDIGKNGEFLTFNQSLIKIPTVAAEWLFRIWKVPGSNLSPEAGYPDWGFSRFSSVPPDKCLDSILN
jgi:hypothetical protein